MIKGWKNCPRWRAYYEARDERREAQKMERYMRQAALRKSQAELDNIVRSISLNATDS